MFCLLAFLIFIFRFFFPYFDCPLFLSISDTSLFCLCDFFFYIFILIVLFFIHITHLCFFLGFVIIFSFFIFFYVPFGPYRTSFFLLLGFVIFFPFFSSFKSDSPHVFFLSPFFSCVFFFSFLSFIFFFVCSSFPGHLNLSALTHILPLYFSSRYCLHMFPSSHSLSIFTFLVFWLRLRIHTSFYFAFHLYHLIFLLFSSFHILQNHNMRWQTFS